MLDEQLEANRRALDLATEVRQEAPLSSSESVEPPTATAGTPTVTAETPQTFGDGATDRPTVETPTQLEASQPTTPATPAPHAPRGDNSTAHDAGAGTEGVPFSEANLPTTPVASMSLSLLPRSRASFMLARRQASQAQRESRLNRRQNGSLDGGRRRIERD